MLIFPSVSPNSRLCERSFGPTDGEEKVEDSENEPSALMMWDVVLTIIDPESLNESVYYQLNLEPLMLVN